MLMSADVHIVLLGRPVFNFLWVTIVCSGHLALQLLTLTGGTCYLPSAQSVLLSLKVLATFRRIWLGILVTFCCRVVSNWEVLHGRFVMTLVPVNTLIVVGLLGISGLLCSVLVRVAKNLLLARVLIRVWMLAVLCGCLMMVGLWQLCGPDSGVTWKLLRSLETLLSLLLIRTCRTVYVRPAAEWHSAIFVGVLFV